MGLYTNGACNAEANVLYFTGFARAQFEGQPVEFLEMDAGYMKFEDNSFDTVCISYSLHHLENIDRVLAEMKRVLKPDGYFVVQEEFIDGEQNEAQKTDMRAR